MVKITYSVRVRKNSTSSFSFEEEMLRRYSERSSCQFFGDINTTSYKFGEVNAYIYQRTLIIPQVRLWCQGKDIKIGEKFMAFTIDNETKVRFFGDADKIAKVRRGLEKESGSFEFKEAA